MKKGMRSVSSLNCMGGGGQNFSWKVMRGDLTLERGVLV